VVIGSFGIYLLIDNFTTIEFSKATYLIMGLAAIPPYLYMIDIFILYRHKQEKLFMRLGFIGAVINLIVGLVFVPIYGILGAAIAVAASKLIMLTVPFFATKSTSGLQRMDK
jgi:O-antigen/teichoic acid export membrane protein